jgi:hypothetical protein
MELWKCWIITRSRHRPASRGAFSKGANAALLNTEEGRAEYGKRMCTVEPVFGQTKHARGFRQFLLRCNQKVNSEWKLVCTAHNLLKLFAFSRQITLQAGAA